MPRRTDPFQRGPLLLDAREDWAARFGPVPIEVEIGFGYGHFLLEYARSHPDLGLVGFEIRTLLARKVAGQARRAGLERVVALKGDARRMLPTLFAPGSVQAFHVQFPDPWWKKRHHKRRLVDPPMVALFARLLAPGGEVHLRTDILDYARAMIETFEDGSGRFENRSGAGRFAAEDVLGQPSNRERRYLASGTPVYRLDYRRTPTPFQP